MINRRWRRAGSLKAASSSRKGVVVDLEINRVSKSPYQQIPHDQTWAGGSRREAAQACSPGSETRGSRVRLPRCAPPGAQACDPGCRGLCQNRARAPGGAPTDVDFGIPGSPTRGYTPAPLRGERSPSSRPQMQPREVGFNSTKRRLWWTEVDRVSFQNPPLPGKEDRPMSSGQSSATVAEPGPRPGIERGTTIYFTLGSAGAAAERGAIAHVELRA